jgi:DNA-binding NtrC family response regulator
VEEKLIFIVDDEPSILKLLTFWVQEKWKYKIKTFDRGKDVLDCLSENPSLVLLDIMLPDINGVDLLTEIKKINENLPVILLSAQGSIEVALKSLKQGAYDYFPKPLDYRRLEPVIKNAISNYDLIKELERLKHDLKEEYKFDNIITSDKKMNDIFAMVTKVLNNDITVLINGESGTGKELIARAIHYNGIRKDQPFVVVNCASIPRELLESELFGHEKGSFTGAYQKKVGKFEYAQGGTLFLDEISEMEVSLQAKILRLVQEKEFERVGGNEIIRSDVRIISATNKDLKECVDNGEFREDLYYRLNSFPLMLPPLRDRRRDVILLINHFIEKFNKKFNKSVKGFNKKSLKYMYDYEWPGNIRELENTVERCMVLNDNDYIDEQVLPPQILNTNGSSNIRLSGPLFSEDSPVIPFEKLKEEAIKHALKVTNGNIVEAAKKLNVGRATIYRIIEKYNIDAKR